MLTALQNPPTPFLRLFSLFFPEVYLAMAAQSLCLLFRYISLICSPTNALSLSIPLAHIHKHRHTQTQKHKRTHKHKNTLSLFHSLTSHRQMTAAQLSIFIRVFAYVNMGVYVYLLIRLKLRTQIQKKRVA